MEEWVRKIITVRALVNIEAVWVQETRLIVGQDSHGNKISQNLRLRKLTSGGCSQKRRDLAVRIGKLGEVPDILNQPKDKVCKCLIISRDFGRSIGSDEMKMDGSFDSKIDFKKMKRHDQVSGQHATPH